MLNINDMVSCCEAILFASGEPVEAKRICEALEIEREELDKIMIMLRDRMEKCDSGLKLLKLENSYQLCTKEKYVNIIRTVMDLKRRVPLSSAAMEVLAVVAYNQPVTKSYIEQVRGVDCTGVVSSLVEKGLLEEKGRLELPGLPLIYGTTEQFLRCFSLSSLDELPEPPADLVSGDIGSQLSLDGLEKDAPQEALNN